MVRCLGYKTDMQETKRAEFLIFMGQCWDLAEDSLRKFGADSQIQKCIEEMAELTAVLAKPNAADELVAEEHADVLIIMSQITRMASYDSQAWSMLVDAFKAKYAKWEGIVRNEEHQ